MQLDLPPRRSWPFLRDPVLRDPVLRDPGVVIARGVEKNMDQRRQWIERLDRFQQLDRQESAGGLGLDHPGLSGFEIDGAVNVYALPPAGLFDRKLFSARRPAACGSRRMGRMHGAGEHHRLVTGQGIHEVFITRDESLLLFFVELARGNVRLVIFKTQPVQQCDQPRAAFGNGAGLLLDESAGLTKTFNALSCAARKSPRCRPCRSWSGLQSRWARRVAPVANGAAAEKQRSGGGPAAPSAVQQHTCVGPPRHPMRRRSIQRQLHPAPMRSGRSGLQAIESQRESSPKTNPKILSQQPISRVLNEPGYISILISYNPLILNDSFLIMGFHAMRRRSRS